MDTERYQRHLALPQIGWEGQRKLRLAKVLVVGAGGLGCPVLQYLTAAGVGVIGIMDYDVVSLSNLQRQVLYNTGSIGRKKVEVAQEMLQALNPDVAFQLYPEKLTEANALAIIGLYDCVVDCTDNLKARYVINDACVQVGKPFVYGSIYQFEGQVSVFNYQNGPTYRCVFAENTAEPPNCADLGVLGVLPGIIGAYQALETIKFITGVGELLSGKLLMVNTLTHVQQIIKINRRAEKIPVTNNIRPADELKQPNPISPVLGQWLQNPNAQFVDVRENGSENSIFPKAQTRHIPLSQLAGYIDELPRDKPIVVFCQSGARSRIAVQMLTQQYGFTNVEDLEGGVNTSK